MITRFLLLLLTYSLLESATATGQPLVTVKVDESTVYVGLDAMISIWVVVQKGYHVQANRVNDESLIPTTLEVNGPKGITIIKQEFPTGKEFKLEGTDTLLSVYDGKFLIKLFLSPDAEIQRGNYVLDAKLRYQACDSKSCLFPRVIDFSIPVEVKTKK
jgi:hypothetical protein